MCWAVITYTCFIVFALVMTCVVKLATAVVYA